MVERCWMQRERARRGEKREEDGVTRGVRVCFKKERERGGGREGTGGERWRQKMRKEEGR